MDPRISLITLGVADMKKSRAFYEALGFVAGAPSNDDVTFFQAGGMILGLYGRAALASPTPPCAPRLEESTED